MYKIFKIFASIVLGFILLNKTVFAFEEKIKIGLLVPITGSDKKLGQQIIKSTRIALKDINTDNLVSHSSKLHLIELFLSIMVTLKIITPKNHNSLTQNIHIIFNKSNLTSNEANLLLGILTKIEKALQK